MLCRNHITCSAKLILQVHIAMDVRVRVISVIKDRKQGWWLHVISLNIYNQFLLLQHLLSLFIFPVSFRS